MIVSIAVQKLHHNAFTVFNVVMTTLTTHWRIESHKELSQQFSVALKALAEVFNFDI